MLINNYVTKPKKKKKQKTPNSECVHVARPRVMFVSLLHLSNNIFEIPIQVLFDSIFFFGIPKCILFPTNKLHFQLQKLSFYFNHQTNGSNLISSHLLKLIEIKDKQGLVIWAPDPCIQSHSNHNNNNAYNKSFAIFFIFIFIFIFIFFFEICSQAMKAGTKQKKKRVTLEILAILHVPTRRQQQPKTKQSHTQKKTKLVAHRCTTRCNNKSAKKTPQTKK